MSGVKWGNVKYYRFGILFLAGLFFFGISVFFMQRFLKPPAQEKLPQYQKAPLFKTGMNGSLFGAFGTGFRTIKQRSPGLQAGESLLTKTSASNSPINLIPQNSSQKWSLLITGDVIPARSVNYQMVKRNDFFWPLTNISHILKNADLTLVNLESPLLTNCPATNEGMKFCGDARFAKALAESGVDVANLANNHSLNYGWEGLKETEQYLQSTGILTTGFSYSSNDFRDENRNPKLKTTQNIAMAKICVECSKLISFEVTNGVTNEAADKATNKSINQEESLSVGFLGFNAVGQVLNREFTHEQIKSGKAKVDVLIVSVHWGREYTREPLADPALAPDDPKELGKLFIDWGADVVVGNHPHWIQPIEWYSDKPIFYALGNTVFDQEWSDETKRGILVKLYFEGTKTVKDKMEIVPIGIRNYGQAYILEGKPREEVLELFKTN